MIRTLALTLVLCAAVMAPSDTDSQDSFERSGYIIASS